MTPAPPKTDVSVVILTYNEEANIACALRSVTAWAKEVFVVDSYSSDRTVEIARQFPQARVFFNQFESYGVQWNWAIDNLPISGAWILKLDADETISPQLRDEIAAETARSDNPNVGYYVRFRLRFMNHWFRFGGFSRTWLLRLWRTNSGRFESRSVNEHVVLSGSAGRLRSYLLHDDQKGLSAWIWRHNRYSTMEAEAYFAKDAENLTGPAGRRRWLKRHVWPFVPLKPTVYFLYLYLFRLAILDGLAGFHLCRLRSLYYYLTELKKKEYRLLGRVSSPEEMVPMPGATGTTESDGPALLHPRVVVDDLDTEMETS